MWRLWWTKFTAHIFFWVHRFPLPILTPSNDPYTHIIGGWYNRPVSIWCTKWTVSPQPKARGKVVHVLN
jgi:hypothetical protein